MCVLGAGQKFLGMAMTLERQRHAVPILLHSGLRAGVSPLHSGENYVQFCVVPLVRISVIVTACFG
jgi:hypothetical protein